MKFNKNDIKKIENEIGRYTIENNCSKRDWLSVDPDDLSFIGLSEINFYANLDKSIFFESDLAIYDNSTRINLEFGAEISFDIKKNKWSYSDTYDSEKKADKIIEYIDAIEDILYLFKSKKEATEDSRQEFLNDVNKSKRGVKPAFIGYDVSVFESTISIMLFMSDCIRTASWNINLEEELVSIYLIRAYAKQIKKKIKAFKGIYNTIKKIEDEKAK